MSIWYVDIDSGNDANGGTSWGDALRSMKAIPTASVSPGDEVRFAKSSDPTSLGSATWTDGSTTVTFASPPTGLTTSDLISKATTGYLDSEPWYSIVSIVDSTVTLRRKYRGSNGSATTYRRITAKPPIVGTVAEGWGSTGGSSINGTAGARIVISGGWNTSSGLRDGQTFIDGQGSLVPIRLHGSYLDLSRVSWTRGTSPSVDQLVGGNCTYEVDNAIDNVGTGVVLGSGIFQGSTLTVQSLCGNGTSGFGDGLHIHTSYNCTVILGKVLDNKGRGVSQNNDFGLNNNRSNTILTVNEIAWNGIAGIGAFNFIGGCDITITEMHDNLVGIVIDSSWSWYESDGVIIQQTAIWRIASAYNNSIDLDFGTTVGVDTVVGTEYLVDCVLNSATPIRYTSDTTIVYGEPPVYESTIASANIQVEASPLTANHTRYATATIGGADIAVGASPLTSTFRVLTSLGQGNILCDGTPLTAEFSQQLLTTALFQLKGAGSAVYPLYIKTV